MVKHPLHTPTYTLPVFVYFSGVSFQGATIRAILLSGVFDLPARAMTLNSIQFNGKYGCSSCLEPGASIVNLNGNKVHTYPYQTDVVSGFHEHRTHQNTVNDSVGATKAEPIKGVKGYSYLAECEGLDMIRGLTTDYMHAFPLGVASMIFHLLTSNEYKDFPWYIGKQMNVLNKRLRSITPPSSIGRWPTSFDNLSKWKASENKSVFQFGILVITKGILPDEYFEHIADLVDAMNILLSDSISPEDLEVARTLICDFCRNFPILYHPSFESANVHSLLHFCDKTADLGPMWCHSAFFYEDLNKDLRDMFCGTRSVHNQVLDAVNIQNQLPILAKRLTPGSEVSILYSDMTTHHKIKSELTKIAPRAYSIGTSTECTIREPLKTRLESQYGRGLSIQKFHRIRLGKAVVHSTAYREYYSKQRNNSTVRYLGENGDGLAGQVKCFLKVTGRGSVANYVAIIKPLVNTNERLGGYLCGAKFGNQLDAIVEVKDLWDQMLYLDSGDDAYVALFPNTVERE